MTSIKDIEDILVDLDMFSRLPANTLVHLNRNNHFIITAQQGAYIIGVQTLANMWKVHTTEKLITDLQNFSKKIIDILQTELNLISQDLINKYEHIKIILIICREFKLAYNGLPNTLNSGMNGLLQTLKTDPLFTTLFDVIIFMKDTIKNIKKTINMLELDGYCPEINFSDDDWAEAMSIVPLLQKEYVGIYKYYINYSSVLTLNQLKFYTQGNWWDEIIKFNDNTSLFLGELPILKGIYGYFERNDLNTLVKLGIKAVLSVTEIFENNTEGYIYSPIMPDDWKKIGVKHYQIPSSDYCTMHLDMIQKGVEFIHWNIKNNRTIYVHCKAGKSRSFLIVLCYLIKYLGYTSSDAINFVKSKRIQAGFGKNSDKMCVLKKFENIINKK